MPELHNHTSHNRNITFWVITISLLFLAANLYMVVVKETMIVSLFPIVLIVLFLFMRSIDKVFLLTAFTSPLSINLNDFDYNIALNLPSEPLLAGILLLYFLYSIQRKSPFSALRMHPVSIAFYFYFAFLFLSSITSQLPLVSWKFFLSHLWLIVPVYFLGTRIFYEKEKSKYAFVFVQIIALTIVVLYTLIRHAGYGFADEEGQWVMQPFFKNHAMYGAALSLFVPITFFFAIDRDRPFIQRFFLFAVLTVFVTGILFSYSRAAWLGVLVAIGIGVIFSFRIKIRVLVLGLLVSLAVGLIFSDKIIQSLEKNEQDSSEEITENLQSISNISTDASNLERLNRWSCALRMARDYPILGTGPGTYQFLYAPYQLSRETTIISTNAGTLGNAHSEFLGPLAEGGIPGFLTVFFLVLIIFVKGFATYIKLRDKDAPKAKIILGLLLGLIAYFVHGVMNNYLDSDKLSIPVWGFTAIIVAMDIKLRQEENTASE